MLSTSRLSEWALACIADFDRRDHDLEREAAERALILLAASMAESPPFRDAMLAAPLTWAGPAWMSVVQRSARTSRDLDIWATLLGWLSYLLGGGARRPLVWLGDVSTGPEHVEAEAEVTSRYETLMDDDDVVDLTEADSESD